MVKDINTVWVVTHGSYSDENIVAVFSTKEKAYNHYNMHQLIDLELNEPEEFKFDKAAKPVYICALKYKNSEWSFREWENEVSSNLDVSSTGRKQTEKLFELK